MQNRWFAALSALAPAAGRCADAAADRVRRAGCREFFCTCSFFCESHPCTMNELRRVCLRHLHAVVMLLLLQWLPLPPLLLLVAAHARATGGYGRPARAITARTRPGRRALPKGGAMSLGGPRACFERRSNRTRAAVDPAPRRPSSKGPRLPERAGKWSFFLSL